MKTFQLTETLCEKDLGIFVDPKQNCNDHISTTVKKAIRLSGMMIGNITIKNKSIIVPIAICPILEYGNAVWCPYKKKRYLIKLNNYKSTILRR